MTEHANGIPLSEAEHTLLRRATFGAIALVSQADPGFFAGFREAMAGSQVLQDAPEDVRQLLVEGGRFPVPSMGPPEEVEARVLADLRRAVQVLAAKAPRQVVGFREVVLAAVDRVAEASDGVAPVEQSTIEKVRDALDSGLAGQPSVGDTAIDAPRRD